MLLIIIINKIQESCIHLLGQSLDISSVNFMFLKTFDSEFSYVKVWFTDQISNSLEIENKINITLVIY